MTTNQLLASLDAMEGRDIDLTETQKDIIRHPGGPGIVTAGPGSGKTEILTLLLLRLLLVDEEGDHGIQNERVPAESVMITTFTEKAAKNLRDRIATYRSFLVDQFPELADVDISQLRIGTLHELCNDIMQEYGWDGHENVRLADKYEQAMLIYEHHSMVRDDDEDRDSDFWDHFAYLFEPYEWQAGWDGLPNKWNRADGLQTLFRSIVEQRVDVGQMRGAGGVWSQLTNAYEEYTQILEEYHRCDFAHLQKRFLNFLEEPLGDAFLTGEEDSTYDGLQWVLVDEYQDTNRVQERIYFKLTEREPYNLVVVGDDDQALYRFRGGSVECMVTFDDACDTFYDDFDGDIAQYPLVQNFRSHAQIVEFCNDYINAFDEMGDGRIDKPDLDPQSGIDGDYEAAGIMRATNLDNLGQRFAETISDLFENGVVDDPRQCCLLLKTTKESPQRAGPFVDAIRDMDNDIEPYNPRNKAFFEQEEVATFMGALLEILDPEGDCCPDYGDDQNEIEEAVGQWRGAYLEVARQHPELRNYVEDSKRLIENVEEGEALDYELLDITYYLMSVSPFPEWKGEHFCRRRLGKLTSLIEAFQSTPVQYGDVSRGRISFSEQGQIHSGWLRKFYHVPIGYVVREGADDVELEDVICPPGKVPIMTIHQAKGLEFPFVFVDTLTEGDDVDDFEPSSEHELEEELARFPIDDRDFEYGSAGDRALRDLVRKYYVAYSRAQYGLVLCASDSQLGSNKAPMGPHGEWLGRNLLRL
jgi:DNA helicase-2/ATP-dependent DNA helicase PcrA